MRAFYWRWLKTAFTHAIGVVDLWTGLISAALSVTDHYAPGLQLATSYGWQIPIWALGAVMAARLLLAPYWMWLEQATQSEAALPVEKEHAEPAVPISLLELSQLADREFGWKLTSGDPSSGWQTWDLSDGLKHAANNGVLGFEGKRFAIYSSPPDNPFLRRGELFQKIESSDWHRLMLTISVPGSDFTMATDNFELSICSSLAGNNTRYWDVRLTDRDAAERWLRSEGPRLKGESEKLHVAEEDRKARERAAREDANREKG